MMKLFKHNAYEIKIRIVYWKGIYIYVAIIYYTEM